MRLVAVIITLLVFVTISVFFAGGVVCFIKGTQVEALQTENHEWCKSVDKGCVMAWAD
jgi:hypothetical protein